jgi:Phospholipid methyltransferase
MRKSAAALGTLIFFLVGPTTTMGVIPWWITGWRMAEPAPYGIGVRSVGAVLIVLGAGVIVHAFVRFVVEGFGTPVPIAPPSHLVVGGPYRYVRNPMLSRRGGRNLRTSTPPGAAITGMVCRAPRASLRGVCSWLRRADAQCAIRRRV